MLPASDTSRFFLVASPHFGTTQCDETNKRSGGDGPSSSCASVRPSSAHRRDPTARSKRVGGVAASSELRAPSRERETERTDSFAPAAQCAVVCHRREGHQLGRCAQFQPGEGRRDQLLDQQDPERSSGSNRKLQMRTPQGAGAAAAAGGAGASPAGAEGGMGCGGKSWGGMS